MGRLLLVWSSIAVLVLAIGVAAASKCIDGEREVLLRFKHSVLDQQDKLHSWGNHSEDCCRDWKGVRCDDATGHVVHIHLYGMFLSAKDRMYTTSLPFFELRYLKYLDLGYNHGLLANKSISSLIGNNSMPSLTYLDLFGNDLEGFIPENLGNSMPALTYLDLSENSLQGPIPDTLANMVKLTDLDLEGNELKGHIPETLGSMPVLEYLNLPDNALEGEIPKSIWNICTLQALNLDSNLLNGSLVISTLCQNHPLQILNLDNNRLRGLFPDLTMFPSLAQLYLGNNLLGGVISEHHFLNLSKLRILALFSNNFTFNITSAWLPPFQLETLILSSCNLGPQFPNWLTTQVNIMELDISNNTISDSIPSSFWNMTTYFGKINISNNGLKGVIGNGAQASIQGGELDMSSNQLEGVIPPSFFNVKVLYLSRNNFTHLTSLCDVKPFSPLQLLDVSFNQLSGTLPDCWSSLSSLQVLNLGNNHNLSGTLPTSIGSLASLKALHLDHNKFIGPLPSSMKSCSTLASLHLGHNNLFGPIPDWMGESLTQLAILVLRSNNFYAGVPTSLCRLQSLQLLDLSMNHISGTLPNCLSNLTQMMIITKGGYISTISNTLAFNITYSNYIWHTASVEDEIIEVRWKGVFSEFGNTLRDVKSIDLSSNTLSGEIPIEITSLVELVSLNLSRNNLTGHIPPRIGNLAKLDALDLSSNHLSGSIPQSLALIHGIGVLNVSNNNLSGRIPKGTQLQSFNASLYRGNPALCGDPLPNSCAGEESTYSSPHGSSEEEEEKFFGGEFYASMGVGYGVGFLGVLWTMLFNRPCRFAFFTVLNSFANWIYVVVAIHKAKFLRSLGG
ncbi:unnamed protein product [Cuscuta epithymum]|uniref:Leucine-rich repeat-containing N-terminal plant-type domain-containing protein n=1 Tax=Cuscuta epithymum TaxID=186058 RepID=A0AAV0FXN1_9ASTE|nr:unnamed protein product [Cuscuta epithymum]